MPTTWKEALENEIPPSVAREIEIFETQIELKRKDQLDDKIFAETRLRRGVYGQRYDNGQRHDGRGQKSLPFPSGERTKGPNTLWDAPGMQRIKIPFGELTARQLEVIAELAEEYADSIAHVTTRQDIQLHFIHLEDTPDLMRRLAAVGITTHEACGNVVRNVTGCPLSGVCGDESFDVTPYAKALTSFLLGHPDAQDFGRKFKISFSGCSGHACALANMHDLGFIARVESGPHGPRRGFEAWVGGGLGAVPHEAKLYDEFLPVEELLPTTQAVCRVFARLGEKRNRARARLKFLIAKVGLEEFRRLVAEERALLPDDDRWTGLLPDPQTTADFAPPESETPLGPFVESYEAWLARTEGPTTEPAPLALGDARPELEAWAHTNVRPQRQPGYYTVTLSLPLGDITAPQMRALADLSREHNGGVLRCTVEQNLLLRWVSGPSVPVLFDALSAIGLAEPGAGTLVDITACPGTDTCKLGIASSRGLAAELRRRITLQGIARDKAVENLRIKISGCFNSCGQHHVADLGFYGVGRKAGNHTVPHFQVVLGGQWRDNAGAYGLPVVAVPSKNVPQVVRLLTDNYLEERGPNESFQDWVRRIGKVEIKKRLQGLTRIPDYAEDPSYYADWSDAREYTLADMGVGECAGEVVSSVDFGLAASERQVFEAQVALDAGHVREAGDKAYAAMVEAARALTRAELLDLPEEPGAIVAEFRRRFHDTGRFHDPFAGAKFIHYLFRAHEEVGQGIDREETRRRIEEAQLFIEAAHACNLRDSQHPANA
jgi:sulfite reductase (ferredoxin)